MKSSLTLFLSLSILLLSTQASFLVLKGTNLNTESIHQNNVADLISHVAGIPPLHEGVDRTNFPDVDLFSMPKANLFVAIDGFTSDIIDRFSGELEFFTTKNAVTIEREAYPSDSLAFLTSVVTGESHTEHGIIGKSWQANGVLAVRAYTPSGQCRTSKIADAVSFGSNGAARTVAFSGTKEMALALGVHSEIAKNHTKWNNQVLHFAHKRGIVSAISDRTVFPSRSAAEFAGTINVSHQSKEGFQFITELFGIENIPNMLKSMTRGDTTLPDFIAIGISGIHAMAQKYGENSAELKVAVEKLDYALAKLSRALNKMYNNKVITQIVGAEYLGEHTTKTQAYQMAKMVNPAIELDEMPNLGSYSYQDVTEFQTSFWVALVLIIAFTVVIITLMKMDMLYDSIVYRTTDGPKPIQDVK